MKIIHSRLRKLEDRFGAGDRKPRILLVVCHAGYQHDIEKHIDIPGMIGLSPLDSVALAARRNPESQWEPDGRAVGAMGEVGVVH